MRVGLGQFDATVGDITGNVASMTRLYAELVEAGADIVVFPEMSICGYPAEDLLHKPHFLEANRTGLERLARACGEVVMVVGFAEGEKDACCNSAAVLKNGKIEKIYRKGMLPNYGVFDEQRYFKAGTKPEYIEVEGMRVFITICEDIWELDWLDDFTSPTGKKDLLLNISASPFHAGKLYERRQILRGCAKRFNCAIAYCNLVGGQDELVFDGRSMFVDFSGEVVARAKGFEEDTLIADIEPDDSGKCRTKAVKAAWKWGDVEERYKIEEVYKALVLGTRDYVGKNGFEKVILGLSGGIDSSLVAAIAAEALGPENVLAVTMPSRFNSAETITDAEKLAENLGIQFETVPIGEVLEEFDDTLSLLQGWGSEGVAYENLQARIRGTILMSYSNQFGCMVLTTGNKSETAVGYSTLYGDTAGGFAVIRDVPKTMVYELCRYINESQGREVVPESVITRIPSAELRENQADSDSLPDYDILDSILKGYIEEDKSAAQIIEQGNDAETVHRVIRLVDRNEYKRRQSPPGVKITPKAFGRDRRMPITNRYYQND
ncbi:Glutamine-dependent NAD(+) synthetase [Anaerohalosphaera lusitana]|uniref:Glutamine-dependent NAD(+) synthetase n=1 Tax=Anaerohalosphaera lusitana TaxID=1936003 RepID=A0A1U9NNP6_9BACT|nr:NAD+ synthase [Anaerohalosphaera lusitana]AQT69348.1 Glutamine-dependent NAD(+) synthetase [Anaerohalosphaera lusitana]